MNDNQPLDRTQHGTRRRAATSGPRHAAHRSGSRPSGVRRLGLAGLIVSVALVAGTLPATASASGSAKGQVVKKQPKARFGSSVSRTAGEDYPKAKQRITRNYGAPGVMRIFNSGLPTSWATIHRELGADAPFVVSFKAAPKDVLSGKEDAYLRQWFADAPKDRRTWWSYYHEPEDNIAKGEFTAAEYRAAWAHIAAVARTAKNPRLRPTLILMTWTLNPSSHRNWRDYYAAGSVRLLAWDGYNPYESQGRYSPPSEMFGRAYQAARSVGLPFGIAEFGSQLSANDNGAKRAAWLRACATYLANHNARFVTYFDAMFVGENDFRLLDQSSKAAWRSVVSAR